MNEPWRYTNKALDVLSEHGAWICVKALREAGIFADDEEKLATQLAELLRDKLGLIVR